MCGLIDVTLFFVVDSGGNQVPCLRHVTMHESVCERSGPSLCFVVSIHKCHGALVQSLNYSLVSLMCKRIISSCGVGEGPGVQAGWCAGIAFAGCIYTCLLKCALVRYHTSGMCPLMIQTGSFAMCGWTCTLQSEAGSALGLVQSSYAVRLLQLLIKLAAVRR